MSTLLTFNQGFQTWLTFTASSLISNAFIDVWGALDEVSIAHGGSQNIEEASSGNLPEWTRQAIQHYRERVYDDVAKKWLLVYRVTKDCGNVAYKDFFEKVAVPEVKERNEIFGFSRASAEKTGDIIEFWLGVLDVANMAKGVVDVFNASVILLNISTDWKRHWPNSQSTSRTTSTINDKRRGSFDCTLQTAEAERVMKIIHAIPDMTRWPTSAASQIGRKIKYSLSIEESTTSQGMTPAWALMPMPSQVTSRRSPWEEEADEPANDPTDVVRDSEISGKQQLLDALGKLFTVSEDVNVCLYCGSTTWPP